MSVLPIFPLQLIAFPGEEVALHIFEPRYLKLVAYCRENNKPFGLVPVFGKRISPVGVCMSVRQIAHQYDDGRLDIRVLAEDPFRIRKFELEPDNSLYHEAEVSILDKDDRYSVELREEVMELYKEFHHLIQTVRVPSVDVNHILSYQLGHTAGLDNEGQLKLLALPSEQHRLHYLRSHFQSILPTLRGVELTRNKIRQNGHIKTIPPADLSDASLGIS
ncbi:MAG: LON peptidase substrate-binding domain-containing protein [Bacteroidetes bacterium]|jgi:hypothetical protein|nr:LON peptidase substrate-binding domain-containing protein [Bacteroidota bacterium]